MVTSDFTVGGPWLHLLLDGLEGTGFASREYARRKGWDLDRLAEPDTRIPMRDVVALWATAARTSGDPHLGLHAAMSFPPRAGSNFGYLLMSSPTLLHGLKLMIQYQDLQVDGKGLSLDDRGDHLAVVVNPPQPPAVTYHQVEYVAALMRRAFTWVVGPAFRLIGVRFSHEGPASAAEHEGVFECPVHFRQRENALLVPREAAERPSLFASPEALETVVAIAERRLAELRSPAWVLRLKTTLASRLSKPGDVGQVARELGVSGRSLQRRLAAEGSSFSKALDETRRERSLELIKRPGATVMAVASETGFTDAQAFARAFRRWTGLSPSAYRARPRAGAEPATGAADDAST